LDTRYRVDFRFLAEHEQLAEQFIDNGVTRRSPLLKAIRDTLSRPPAPGTATITLGDASTWLDEGARRCSQVCKRVTWLANEHERGTGSRASGRRRRISPSGSAPHMGDPRRTRSWPAPV